MANDFIGISVTGDVDIDKRIMRLASDDVIGRANKAIAEFIRTQAQKYPVKKSVTRKQAYGQTFQSDKQRRFFFSAVRSGSIKVPYKRTGGLRRGWEIMPFGSSDYLVYNEAAHAALVMGSGTQARMMTIIGWKTIEQIADKAAQEKARRIMEDEINKEAGRIVYV